jgi:hypothetical protein
MLFGDVRALRTTCDTFETYAPLAIGAKTSGFLGHQHLRRRLALPDKLERDQVIILWTHRAVDMIRVGLLAALLVR